MGVLHDTKSAQSNVERTPSSNGPPAYTDETTNISAAFSNLDLSEHGSRFPSQSECISHLKLLEAFHHLKEDIVSRDGLFGIQDSFVPNGASNGIAADILERIRDKRWEVFVAKAVKRFQYWFKHGLSPLAQMLRISAMGDKEYTKTAVNAPPMRIEATQLPPLDVLMVWHAYILNPRTYLADCTRFGKHNLWAAGLPLKTIDSVIDNETLAYEPSDEAKAIWVAVTDSPWDPLEESNTVTIVCPKCNTTMTQAWTTFTESVYFSSNDNSDYRGRGFADQGFRVACPCGVIIDHNMLRCYKFMADLKDLVSRDVPMPGTLLSKNGIPGSYRENLDDRKSTADMMFPNQLLRDGALSTAFGDSRDPNIAHPADIRELFERAMTKDVRYLSAALGTRSVPKLRPLQRMSVRKMMACYWDNSSIFSMDLIGAVIRQGIFVTKMYDIDWLHSPALHSTTKRLLIKYERFFTIMAKYPNEVAVPTLDVDLAWHTHQLSPQSYYNYSTTTTRDVFIDHDDKIADSKLSMSFEWTSKTYQKLFNSLYSECTCWYCEAIRESSNSGIKRLFGSESNGVKSELDQLHRVSTSNDPSKAPHISAHNAIKALDNKAAVQTETFHNRKLEVGYQRACAKAKKSGRAPPDRDAYSTTYGYYPYAAYPYWAPIYVATPACGSFGPGAIGNCAAGTCGGGVAMGSCAGAAGSCAGVAAGCGGGAGLGSVGGSCGGGGSSGGGCGGGGGGGCGGGGGGGGGGCGGGGGG